MSFLDLWISGILASPNFSLARIFRVFRLLRLIRLIRQFKGLQQLIFTTFYTIPSMFNVTGLFILV
jgi:hypothetical protein